MTPVREPTLADLLNDPVIRLVMRADGVAAPDILALYRTGDTIPADSPPAYICSRLAGSVCRPNRT